MTTACKLTIGQAITDMLATESLILQIMYLGTWESFLRTMDEFNELPEAVRHGSILSLRFTSRSNDPSLEHTLGDNLPLTRNEAKQVLDVMEGVFAHTWSREELVNYWKEEKRVYGKLLASDN